MGHEKDHDKDHDKKDKAPESSDAAKAARKTEEGEKASARNRESLEKVG